MQVFIILPLLSLLLIELVVSNIHVAKTTLHWKQLTTKQLINTALNQNGLNPGLLTHSEFRVKLNKYVIEVPPQRGKDVKTL
jgi:hypothetical protein